MELLKIHSYLPQEIIHSRSKQIRFQLTIFKVSKYAWLHNEAASPASGFVLNKPSILLIKLLFKFS